MIAEKIQISNCLSLVYIVSHGNIIGPGSDFDEAEDDRRDLEWVLQIGESSSMEMKKQLPLPRLEAVTQTLLTLQFCHQVLWTQIWLLITLRVAHKKEWFYGTEAWKCWNINCSPPFCPSLSLQFPNVFGNSFLYAAVALHLASGLCMCWIFIEKLNTL